jgi:hypothetical protein
MRTRICRINCSTDAVQPQNLRPLCRPRLLIVFSSGLRSIPRSGAAPHEHDRTKVLLDPPVRLNRPEVRLRQIDAVVDAAATVLTLTATALLGLTLLSLAVAGATVAIPRVRRHVRIERVGLGLPTRLRR